MTSEVETKLKWRPDTCAREVEFRVPVVIAPALRHDVE